MQRYMIEATHDPVTDDCHRVIESCLRAGAHYLTKAEWGCRAGVHKAWITVEAESDAEARLVVPPIIRGKALVVKVDRFTPDQLKELHKETVASRAQGAPRMVSEPTVADPWTASSGRVPAASE